MRFRIRKFRAALAAGCVAGFMPSALSAALSLTSPADYATVATLPTTLKNYNTASSTYQYSTYSTADTAARKELENAYHASPTAVTLAWSGASGSSTVTVKRVSDGKTVLSETTSGTSVDFKDPEIGRNYVWTVQNGTATATGHFFTERVAPRIVNQTLGGIGNARDLGGWSAADGKVVRQGMLFRCEEWDFVSKGYYDAGCYPKPYWRDTVGIRLDLDLRKRATVEEGYSATNETGYAIGKSPIDFSIPRYHVEDDGCSPFGGYGSINGTGDRKCMYCYFQKFIDSSNYPILFHCSHGKDRTGSLALVLSGLLGVSRQDMNLDWIYSWAEDSEYTLSAWTIDQAYNAINNNYSGSTFKDKCAAYVTQCYKDQGKESQAAADIATFRALMLETPETAAVKPSPADPTAYGAADTAARTYTWKGFDGPWEYTTNWTASATPCYGIPSHKTYATADFPASLTAATACTLTSDRTVKYAKFDSPNLTLTIDNATLTVTGTLSDGYYSTYNFGNTATGNPKLVFKGATPCLTETAVDYRANFGYAPGGATGLCTLRFEVPAANWAQAPIRTASKTSVCFHSNVAFEIDATALGVPVAGVVTTVPLAYAPGGFRFYNVTLNEIIARSTVVCASGAKGTVAVDGNALVLNVVADDTPPEPETYDVTLESLLDEMCDADAATRLAALPWTGRLWSSYDRASVSASDPTTWFANNDRSNFVATNTVGGQTEYVMVDAKGAGALTRLWTANGYGTVYRFYVDGASEPVVSGVGTNLIGGHVLCGAPLADEVAPGQDFRRRAQNLYLPIPFAKSLVVTAELKDIPPDDDKAKSVRLWYNAEVRTYAAGTRVEPFSSAVLARAQGAITSANAALASPPAPATDASQTLDGTLAAGESRSVTFTRTGAVRSFALKLAGDGEPLRTVRVKIAFDGETTVDASAGQLFGAGYAATAYAMVNGGISADGTMTLRQVMPFAESCTVTLENTGTAACTVSGSAVAVGAYDWDADRSLHFGALGFEERTLPTRRGAAGYFDLPWVRLDGCGYLVGNALAVDNSQSEEWWGEGDEKIYVDGEAFPSYFGTGTEDFFGYAWSSSAPFADHPFLSLPLSGGTLTGGQRLVTTLRTRRLDAVPFSSSLKLDVEVWHWADCTMDYAPATFWYARPGVTVTPGGLPQPVPEPKPVPISPAFDAAHTIICYGDSLTEGTYARKAVHASLPNYFDGRLDGVSIEEGYPYWLSTMVTNGYNVIAQALAGASTDIILGWQGASVLKTTLPLTLPAAANEYVPLSTNLLFNGNYGGYMHEKRGNMNYFGFLAPLYPLIGAIPHDGTNYITAAEGAMSGWLNGVHVRIRGRYPAHDGKPYQTICRTEAASAPTAVPLGTRFVSDAAVTYSNAIQVICAGANDDVTRMADVVFPLIETAVRGAARYIVVSPVIADAAVEAGYASRFGGNYLNSRQQLSARGLSLAVRLGLMTEAEAASTTWNAKDGSGLMYTDSVHLTTRGYAVKAYLVYEKLVELGYVKGALLPPDPTAYGAADTKATTYAWKGNSGPWHYTTNWTAGASATYGIPNQKTYATADFPATQANAFTCTVSKAMTVKYAKFDSPNMTLVLDNATLTCNSRLDTETWGAYNFGNTQTGTTAVEFRGANAAMVTTLNAVRANFGWLGADAATGTCTVRFVVPKGGWTTAKTAPVRTGRDSKVVFKANVRMEVDATALGVPAKGATNLVYLAASTDGMFHNGTTSVACAPGATGTVAVEGLNLVLRVTAADNPYYNEETGKGYASAQEAMDAAKPGEVVRVLANPPATETLRMKPGVTVDTQGFANVKLAADPWFDVTCAAGSSYFIQLNDKATPTVTSEDEVPAIAIDGTTVRIHAAPLCSNLWYGVGVTNALGGGPFPVETWRQVKQGETLDFELKDQPAEGRFYQIRVKDRE